MITASTFITYVKAKLNRLDTAAYEDVLPEEIIFFANNALKNLVLEFDKGVYSPLVDFETLVIYLAGLKKTNPELLLVDNAAVLPTTVFKFKSMQAFVTVGSESGWSTCADRSHKAVHEKEDNPFAKSYPDEPHFRAEDGKVKIDTDGTFNATKIRYTYLERPETIDEETEISFPFVEELENKTVTLLLENLEGRRLETQPTVSKM